MMNLNKIIPFSFLIGVAFSCLTGCTDLVNFSEEELKEVAIKIGGESCITEESSSPLIVVNDKITHHVSLKNLKPEYINSVSILKGEKALKLFGSAGKDGVVQIQTDQKVFSSDSKEK